MAYYHDYQTLHYEADSGEWQTLCLVFYSHSGMGGYEIPNDEVLPFLKSHGIFVATFYPDEVNYIPTIGANIQRLNDLIQRQEVLFNRAADAFDSCKNLDNPEHGKENVH